MRQFMLLWFVIGETQSLFNKILMFQTDANIVLFVKMSNVIIYVVMVG